MTICFVSGHIDLTKEEFDEYYSGKLQSAIATGASFVVGDARGADDMAQAFLASQSADVTVYHMFTAPRHNYGFKTIGGFDSDLTRDEAMTAASNIDIAWVRPGREKSGTAKNLQRRNVL